MGGSWHRGWWALRSGAGEILPSIKDQMVAIRGWHPWEALPLRGKGQDGEGLSGLSFDGKFRVPVPGSGLPHSRAAVRRENPAVCQEALLLVTFPGHLTWPNSSGSGLWNKDVRLSN